MKPRQLDRCDRRMVRERLIKAPKVQEDRNADVARVSRNEKLLVILLKSEHCSVYGSHTGRVHRALIGNRKTDRRDGN